MERKTIYVAGYPKSGTTWLTWLLADVLDSPAGGSMPKEDRKELATEGLDRPGPYVVRKGHFVLMEGAFDKAVPTPHRMAPSGFKDERVAWIVRDPRDLAVSAKHYFKSGHYSISEILHYMRRGTGPFRGVGPLNQYITAWLGFSRNTMVKYEDLLAYPQETLRNLLVALNLPTLPDKTEIKRAIQRQEFSRKKREMNTDSRPNSDIGKNLMRVGKQGQWQHEFSDQNKKEAAQYFNPTMARLGYIDNGEWWRV